MDEGLNFFQMLILIYVTEYIVQIFENPRIFLFDASVNEF